MLYTAFYKNCKVESETLRGLKMELTKIANRNVDMFADAECYISYGTDRETHFTLSRTYKILPDNSFKFSKWK